MIYFVEDDDSIRELVLYTLNNAGYEAKGFSRPSLFWEAVQIERPRLVLLDIMLPEEDGLQILKKLRSASSTSRVPIMMLTAKSTEYDKVIGLDYGADDYLPKPFGMMELIARVKALLRRAEVVDGDKEYVIGSLRITPSRHKVSVDGHELSLTLKEFEMLTLFAENQGIVFTRDQLLTKIWGYAFDGESRTVDVHIRSLRQKLGDAGKLIETVRGIGYKLGES
ncbi:MAG: response regulator transcription factor [Firmicutes bacterium]|nr:response regulator transcription factor [Bacillota bacterium]